MIWDWNICIGKKIVDYTDLYDKIQFDGVNRGQIDNQFRSEQIDQKFMKEIIKNRQTDNTNWKTSFGDKLLMYEKMDTIDI